MDISKKSIAITASLGIATLIFVSGCGAKGKLYLPEEQQQTESSASMEPAVTDSAQKQAEVKKAKPYRSDY